MLPQACRLHGIMSLFGEHNKHCPIQKQGGAYFEKTNFHMAGTVASAAGTAGQYLVSNGNNAPTWQALPTILKKYTAQNGALTAAGGAWTWSIAQATHGVTAPLVVQLFDSSGNMVMADVAVATNCNVTIVINDTASAGTLVANTYRVVIIG